MPGDAQTSEIIFISLYNWLRARQGTKPILKPTTELICFACSCFSVSPEQNVILEQLQATFKFYDPAFKKLANETFQSWFNNVMIFLWEVVKYHYEYMA